LAEAVGLPTSTTPLLASDAQGSCSGLQRARWTEDESPASAAWEEGCGRTQQAPPCGEPRWPRQPPSTGVAAAACSGEVVFSFFFFSFSLQIFYSKVFLYFLFGSKIFFQKFVYVFYFNYFIKTFALDLCFSKTFSNVCSNLFL
jgi:hypothetical protein